MQHPTKSHSNEAGHGRAIVQSLERLDMCIPALKRPVGLCQENIRSGLNKVACNGGKGMFQAGLMHNSGEGFPEILGLSRKHPPRLMKLCININVNHSSSIYVLPYNSQTSQYLQNFIAIPFRALQYFELKAQIQPCQNGREYHKQQLRPQDRNN